MLPARVEGIEPQEFVGRLARFEFGEDGGDPVASVGPVKILASAEIDAEAVAARLEERREELRSEVGAGGGQARQRGVRRQGAGRGRRGGAAEARALPRRAGGAGRIDAGDAEAYLDSLEPIGWKLGLERMRTLSTLLGMPQHRFASIHVVGTNGKSSVTRMIAALLEAHGVCAGACVSPHAARWSERVLIHGEEIGAAEFAAAVERAAAGGRDRQPRLCRRARR